MLTSIMITHSEAESLLLDPERPFNEYVWEPIPDLRSGVSPLSPERRAAMDASASALLGVIAGAPPCNEQLLSGAARPPGWAPPRRGQGGQVRSSPGVRCGRFPSQDFYSSG